MKKETIDVDNLSVRMLAELQAAANLPDDEIDLTDPDAPERTDWSGAKRGYLHRDAATRLASLRIDADVLSYFEMQGPGYEARMNQALRRAMLLEMRQPKKRRTA